MIAGPRIFSENGDEPSSGKFPAYIHLVDGAPVDQQYTITLVPILNESASVVCKHG